MLFSLHIFAFPTTPAHSQELVTIKGNLINQSPNSDIPVQQTVFLQIVGGDTGVMQYQTNSGRNGYFEFPNIPSVPSDSYSLITNYMDIEYSLPLNHPLGERPITFEIYNTTQNINILNIDSHTLLIHAVDPVNLSISAMEIILLTNNDKLTFQPLMDGPENMNFLRFSLVQEWSSLEVQSDLPNAQIINVGSGFGLYGSIKPGFHQIAFSYQFPYDKDNSTISHSFLQKTSKFRVLIPENSGLISGSAYESLGVVDLEGTVYNVWETQEPANSITLTTHLSELPQPSLWETLLRKANTTNFATIWFPILFAISLVGLLAFAIFYKSRIANSIEPDISGNIPVLTDRSYELQEAISRLDAAFIDGNMDQSTYIKERKLLKTKFPTNIGNIKCE
jgi:hypothetical protein